MGSRAHAPARTVCRRGEPFTLGALLRHGGLGPQERLWLSPRRDGLADPRVPRDALPPTAESVRRQPGQRSPDLAGPCGRGWEKGSRQLRGRLVASRRWCGPVCGSLCAAFLKLLVSLGFDGLFELLHADTIRHAAGFPCQGWCLWDGQDDDAGRAHQGVGCGRAVCFGCRFSQPLKPIYVFTELDSCNHLMSYLQRSTIRRKWPTSMSRGACTSSTIYLC